jgi:hypothetical protein
MMSGSVAVVRLPQGDVGLLDSEVARRRYGGPEQAAAALAEVDQPGTRMARIALRPSWVGAPDFQTRFPGGGTAEQFDRRGRS